MGIVKCQLPIFTPTPHTHTHTHLAEVAQLVEHQLPKLRVAGSNPVFRSKSKRQKSTSDLWRFSFANCQLPIGN